jgi:hypothetical protein
MYQYNNNKQSKELAGTFRKESRISKPEETGDVLQNVEGTDCVLVLKQDKSLIRDIDDEVDTQLNELFLSVSCFVTMHVELPLPTVCFVTFFLLQFIVFYIV